MEKADACDKLRLTWRPFHPLSARRRTAVRALAPPHAAGRNLTFCAGEPVSPACVHSGVRGLWPAARPLNGSCYSKCHTSKKDWPPAVEMKSTPLFLCAPSSSFTCHHSSSNPPSLTLQTSVFLIGLLGTIRPPLNCIDLQLVTVQ